MKKKIEIVIRGAFALALALFCTMQFGIDVRAGQVVDTQNGVSYNDEENISVGYAYDYAYGGAGYSYIDIDIKGDRIANVKSNSKNLIAKKTREYHYHKTEKDYDTDQIVATDEYSYASISYFAKKKGTYKVSFDVVKPDGTVRCTKTITVKATGSTTYVDPFKSVTFAGKDIYSYFPYSQTKSGKIKVSMKKGYKLVSIEVGTYNNKNILTYKKVKNNAKISLASSRVYKSNQQYSYGGYSYTIDDLFPYTSIKITYKNTKTGEVETSYRSLYTLNKRQLW